MADTTFREDDVEIRTEPSRRDFHRVRLTLTHLPTGVRVHDSCDRTTQGGIRRVLMSALKGHVEAYWAREEYATVIIPTDTLRTIRALRDACDKISKREARAEETPRAELTALSLLAGTVMEEAGDLTRAGLTAANDPD